MLSGRLDEALRVYDDVVRRFGHAPEPSVRQEVAAALTGKGATLGQLGRAADALHVYAEVSERFGRETELSLLVPVAIALRNAGLTYEGLGQVAAAQRSYAELEARFGNASDEQLREHVEVDCAPEAGSPAMTISLGTSCRACARKVRRLKHDTGARGRVDARAVFHELAPVG